MKSFYEFLQAMEMNGVQPTATTPGATQPGATNTQPEYVNILKAFATNPAAIRSLEKAGRITDPNIKKALTGIANDVATIAKAKKLTGGKSTGANPVPSAGSGMVSGVKPAS